MKAEGKYQQVDSFVLTVKQFTSELEAIHLNPCNCGDLSACLKQLTRGEKRKLFAYLRNGDFEVDTNGDVRWLPKHMALKLAADSAFGTNFRFEWTGHGRKPRLNIDGQNSSISYALSDDDIVAMLS